MTISKPQLRGSPRSPAPERLLRMPPRKLRFGSMRPSSSATAAERAAGVGRVQADAAVNRMFVARVTAWAERGPDSVGGSVIAERNNVHADRRPELYGRVVELSRRPREATRCDPG
jgi:hypothetical protein